ncbi:MAG: type IV pilus assembly protein PilM [Candidatus Moranbacteria bacterium]|nr:type IV pilus assembly protein PilM [Candidatus Moranbacteria bacterium]
MFNFFRKNYFLGIDFGTSAVKIVELTLKNQKAHLVNYGWIELGLSLDSNGKEVKLLSFDDKLKIRLKDLVKRMELKSNSAYVSMPGFSGLVVLIDFPAMKREELEKAIQFEAHKYIPTPLSEISLGWDFVSKEEENELLGKKNPARKVQVLLVAAPNKEVARYESIVRGTGLAVKAIELETFSLARSLVGDDLGTFLIIDIGARATNIMLVDKGIVKVNRNIDAGGNEVTNTIADSINISKQRAEAFKKEGKDLLNSKESSIIIPTLEMIANESLRIISAYRERGRDARIDGVILSGGSAKLKGIDEYFSKTLEIRSSLGNPWKKIIVSEQLSSVVKKMGTSYSVALGLALRGIEEYQRS